MHTMWNRSGKLIGLCFGLVMIIFLTGCDPRCEPADMVAPIPTGPGPLEIVSSPVTFSWDWSATCVPGNYEVLISDNLDFTNPASETGGNLIRSGDFTRSVSLNPGKQYWWNITGVAASEGPPGIPGPTSELMTFIAGPVCTPVDLVAPTVLYPYLGDMVTTAFPILAFETAGNCASNYRIDFQTDQNFGGVNYLAANDPFTATRVVPDAEHGLPDCTEFYWRVRATIDGVDGPFSPTYSFRTDFNGTCTYGQEVVVTPPTLEPTQPESPVPPTPTPEAPEFDRCALFDEENISLTMLDIAPDSTVQTIYLTIPGGVPGLELPVPEAPTLWEYSATLGSAIADVCTYEGYAERLYCTFELSPAALGTTQELFAYVNGCFDPFYHHPGVSIFEPAPVCTADLPESECIAVGGTFVHVTDTQDICDCP